MDYRCPHCGADLKKLRLAIISRIELDCPRCARRLRVNVHRSEELVVMLTFGAIVAAAGLAYWLGSERLVLLAVVVGMAGVVALPLIERTWLQHWPRYVRPEAGASPPG